MTRALLLILLVASGCRLETPAPEPASEASGDSASVSAPDPPVAAGDTTRVTARRAGEATPRQKQKPLAPNVSGSGWAVPVLGIAPEDLVDTFTAARSEGRTHNAIDILAPRGTPVVAAFGGTVQRLFTSDKGGLTVYVLGDEGRIVTYYAHLDAYAPGLEAGQRIAQGEPIGTVGDTGNAAPGNTHLHFAIWTIEPGDSFWDGEPINPYDLLAR